MQSQEPTAALSPTTMDDGSDGGVGGVNILGVVGGVIGALSFVGALTLGYIFREKIASLFDNTPSIQTGDIDIDVDGGDNAPTTALRNLATQ
ncbi:MAG: hypothetical protein AAF153_03105 [Pseudomonadota bacterium]